MRQVLAEDAPKGSICKQQADSNTLKVLAAPDKLHAPVMIPPMLPCQGAVQVSNLHQGASV